jgi:hypothetical protein
MAKQKSARPCGSTQRLGSFEACWHVLLIRMNRQFQVFCSVLSWNPEWDGHKVGGNEGWGGMGWLAVTRSDCCSATSVMPSAVPLNRFQRTRVHQ